MPSLSLLIGSGVSYYSGIPSLNEITGLVLSGKNVSRNTDSHYYINKPINPLNQNHNKHFVVNNVNLIKELVTTIDEFYSQMGHNHKSNYEDIYFVNRQICDSYLFEYENPAIIKLINYLKQKLNISNEELKETSIETTKYIECIVWRLINKKFNNSDQFKILIPLISDYNLKSIISLNHDIVMEDFFKINNIRYNDGFTVLNKNLPEWTGYSNNNSKIILSKLHGSINWFSVMLRNSSKQSTIMKIPKGIYPERLYEIHDSIDIGIGRPELLIGTFNKMWGYLLGIFEESFYFFKKSLDISSTLIISGYGFGDKGINTKLGNCLIVTFQRRC